MKLSFFTKDYRLDYPNIGWIPRLEAMKSQESSAEPDIPAILDGLNQYCSGCYPELILMGQRGSWTLYLTALDSGRLDYMGRVIRVSLLLKSDEQDSKADRQSAYRFLQKYLESMSTGSNSVTIIKDLLAGFIPEGQPKIWCEQSKDKQTELAQTLLTRILDRYSDPDAASDAASSQTEDQVLTQDLPAFWYAGAGVGQQSFSQLCGRILLDNEPKAPCRAAMALSYLGPKDLSNPEVSSLLWKQVGSPMSGAIVFTNDQDLTHPITVLTPYPDEKKDKDNSMQKFTYLLCGACVISIALCVLAVAQNSWYRQVNLENQSLSAEVAKQEQLNAQLQKDAGNQQQKIAQLQKDVELLKTNLNALDAEKQKALKEIEAFKRERQSADEKERS